MSGASGVHIGLCPWLQIDNLKINVIQETVRTARTYLLGNDLAGEKDSPFTAVNCMINSVRSETKHLECFERVTLV